MVKKWVSCSVLGLLPVAGLWIHAANLAPASAAEMPITGVYLDLPGKDGPGKERFNITSAIGGAAEPSFFIQEDKPVEQVRKNIQVLKGMPASQLLSVMNLMRSSLGVRCDYCHVMTKNQGPEKDDKPTKQVARKHIQMVFDINKTLFEGKKVVTCNTCHQGQPKPVAVPPIGQGAFKDQVIEEPVAKTADPLPPANEVVNRYIATIGGKAAIDRVKTVAMKGVQIEWDGRTVPIELYAAAPNELLVVLTYSQQAIVTQGFNGTTGWLKNPRGQNVLVGEPLTQLKRSASFYQNFLPKDLYSKMEVVAKQKIDNHDAYVIEATTSENKIEKLYFDLQTGLFLRRSIEMETVLGMTPEQTDFEDYRDVDGLKMPFSVRVSYLDTHIATTRKFAEIRQNVSIDAGKFNLPAPK